MMKNKFISSFLPPMMVVLCLFMMVLSEGCSMCGGPKDQDSADTMRKPSQTELSITPQKPASATLLFDASGSMAGYLNGGDPRFVGVISAFENLPDNIKNRLFGEKEESPMDKAAFEKKLNNRNIKWSHESNLIAMVDSMVRHIDGGDDVCFLVTDGILSGSNSEINSSPEKKYNITQREKMSKDLSAKLKGKKGDLCALIVGYSALFKGSYSCYNNAAVQLNHARPFYVIALGKWQYIKYIENELENIKKEGGLSTAYDDIFMIGDLCSYQKLKLSEGEGLTYKKKKWYVKKGVQEITLTSRLDTLPSYMRTEEYMKENIQLWVGKTLLDQNCYNVSVNNDKLVVSIKSSQVKGNCELTFKLKFAFPKWISQKSDENDLDINKNPVKVDKTFNLQYFVEGFKVLHEGEFVKEISKKFN